MIENISKIKNYFSDKMIEEYPYFEVITHNDNDGNCSAIQLCHLEKIHNKNIVAEDLYKHVQNIDYNVNVVDIVKDIMARKQRTRVFITDISLNMEALSELGRLLYEPIVLEGLDIELLWIDHHLTSVESLDKYLGTIFGNMHLFDYIVSDSIDGYKCAACELVNHLITTWYPDNSYQDNELVMYVDDWDIMRLKYSATVDIKYALESFGHISTQYGYNNWMDAYEKDNTSILDIVKMGENINDYLKSIYRNKFFKSFYNTIIDGHKCVAVCAQEHESRVFADLDDLDPDKVYMVWHYTGNFYNFSIYSAPTSKINCKDIATKFGGGGHPHASGFNLLDNPFTKSDSNCELNEEDNTSYNSLICQFKDSVKYSKENDPKIVLHHKACIAEECMEAGKEIMKDLRDKLNKKELIKEIADLRIVIESAKVLYDITDKEIEFEGEQKLRRFLFDPNYKK